ncbi:MAG: family 10 glycosylhydrolase [Candidatus Marinimicrobia bacterium]|nr:family 10 glycosylhydrolase [Candidatus Neomarinimicrobiota bacterium]
MKKIAASIILSVLLLFSFLTGEEELRGAWFAWAGTNVPSRDLIAEAMEALADANFNIVYVDVWRYGYPYFRSKVFHAYTGLYTDPGILTTLAPERDVLAEMIAEAHRVGLKVDAWFEAGFNAGITTGSPIYRVRPEWLARTQNGSVAAYGQAGPSCIHVLPEVQRFLIDLTREVVASYDIDGIEFDRVRYPQLDCGYDDFTRALYFSEKGTYPPTSVSDAAWIRWRADKLTDFVALMYDSVKALNPDIIVSNAPLPWGYEQFCQDYAPWIDNGYLDIVAPQMYMNSNSDFTWRMNNELAKISRDSLMFPGISTVANSNYTSPAELVQMIRTTRNAGLKGNVIWYHAELIYNDNDYLSYLKENVYQNKAGLPYREPGWRPDPLIVDIDSSGVLKTGNWELYNGTNVYDYHNDSHCYIAAANVQAQIDYRLTIPESGWYAVYAFQNIPKSMASATDMTLFTVHSDSGEAEGTVNQKTAGNAGRWEKLATAYFEAGENKTVLTLSTPGTGSGYTFADALMLVRSRNPFGNEEFIYVNAEKTLEPPQTPVLFQNYPNPFNPETTIPYTLSEDAEVSVSIYDICGKLVRQIPEGMKPAGEHRLHLQEGSLSSGIYFYVLNVNGKKMTIKKMTMVK